MNYARPKHSAKLNLETDNYFFFVNMCVLLMVLSIKNQLNMVLFIKIMDFHGFSSIFQLSGWRLPAPSTIIHHPSFLQLGLALLLWFAPLLCALLEISEDAPGAVHLPVDHCMAYRMCSWKSMRTMVNFCFSAACLACHPTYFPFHCCSKQIPHAFNFMINLYLCAWVCHM